MPVRIPLLALALVLAACGPADRGNADASRDSTPTVDATMRGPDDLVLLSLEGVSDMTDYFLIASGTSDTHVRSLGNSVLEEMKRDVGQMAHHVEGLSQGRWVLLDYVDVVVHIFHPTLRNFYQIERLWADAETVPLRPTR